MQDGVDQVDLHGDWNMGITMHSVEEDLEGMPAMSPKVVKRTKAKTKKRLSMSIGRYVDDEAGKSGSDHEDDYEEGDEGDNSLDDFVVDDDNIEYEENASQDSDMSGEDTLFHSPVDKSLKKKKKKKRFSSQDSNQHSPHKSNGRLFKSVDKPSGKRHRSPVKPAVQELYGASRGYRVPRPSVKPVVSSSDEDDNVYQSLFDSDDLEGDTNIFKNRSARSLNFKGTLQLSADLQRAPSFQVSSLTSFGYTVSPENGKDRADEESSEDESNVPGFRRRCKDLKDRRNMEQHVHWSGAAAAEYDNRFQDSENPTARLVRLDKETVKSFREQDRQEFERVLLFLNEQTILLAEKRGDACSDMLDKFPQLTDRQKTNALAMRHNQTQALLEAEDESDEDNIRLVGGWEEECGVLSMYQMMKMPSLMRSTYTQVGTNYIHIAKTVAEFKCRLHSLVNAHSPDFVPSDAVLCELNLVPKGVYLERVTNEDLVTSIEQFKQEVKSSLETADSEDLTCIIANSRMEHDMYDPDEALPGDDAPGTILGDVDMPLIPATSNCASKLTIDNVRYCDNSINCLLSDLEALCASHMELNQTSSRLLLALPFEMLKQKIAELDLPRAARIAMEHDADFFNNLREIRHLAGCVIRDVVLMAKRNERYTRIRSSTIHEVMREMYDENPDSTLSQSFHNAYVNNVNSYPHPMTALIQSDRETLDMCRLSEYVPCVDTTGLAEPIDSDAAKDKAENSGTGGGGGNATSAVPAMVSRVMKMCDSAGLVRLGTSVHTPVKVCLFTYKGQEHYLQEPLGATESGLLLSHRPMRVDTPAESLARKCNEALPYASPPFFTGGYQNAGSIENLVRDVHTNPAMATASSYANYASSASASKQAAAIISRTGDTRLPTLKRNRYKRSFRDGVLDFSFKPGTQPVGVVRAYNTPMLWDIESGASREASIHSYDTCISQNDIGGPRRTWKQIKAPHFRGLVQHQLHDMDKQFYFYAMIGRLLFPLNRHDHFEVIMVVLGIANSGKSTVGNVALNFYAPEDVGVLSSNMEPQFGMQVCLGKMMWACLEMTKSFAMNRGELQSAATGERFSVSVKHEPAQIVDWDIPGILSGNQLAEWTDTLGALLRRLFTFIFANRILNTNTRLNEMLNHEMGEILLLCFYAYVELLRRVGKNSIWDAPCPDYFHLVRLDMASETSPVIAMLMEDNLFARVEGLECSMRELSSTLISAHRLRASSGPRDHSGTTIGDMYSGTSLESAVYAMGLKIRPGIDGPMAVGICPAPEAMTLSLTATLGIEHITRIAVLDGTPDTHNMVRRCMDRRRALFHQAAVMQLDKNPSALVARMLELQTYLKEDAFPGFVSVLDNDGGGGGGNIGIGEDGDEAPSAAAAKHLKSMFNMLMRHAAMPGNGPEFADYLKSMAFPNAARSLAQHQEVEEREFMRRQEEQQQAPEASQTHNKDKIEEQAFASMGKVYHTAHEFTMNTQEVHAREKLSIQQRRRIAKQKVSSTFVTQLDKAVVEMRAMRVAEEKDMGNSV